MLCYRKVISKSAHTLSCIFSVYKVKRTVMKKLFLILFSLGLAIGASAQKYYHGGYHYYSHPRVIVSGGFYAPYYPYYGFGFPYYGIPPYGYGYAARPTKLEMQVEDIRRDYSDRIYSAKHDKSLSHSERRETVRELKRERDTAIDNAKNNYYKTR